MKRIFVYFGIVFLSILVLGDVYGSEDGKIRKVVIDAGHGGKDPGTHGKYAEEKDIALAIALKTGEYIEKYLPDVEVIYTRKTDIFIELHKRAKIANDAQADLFISIHCNGNNSSQPYGTETYVMGLHKSSANLAVAQKENAAILKEEGYEEEYEGFNPQSPEAYIIFSLFQNAFLDQSLDFASKVQKQFKERVGLRDRGVMQAGFLVLYRTTMPGVLVETGYLTNSKDEKFLRSKDGQTYIASAIYRAFKEYKQAVEKDLTAQTVVANTRNLSEDNGSASPEDNDPEPRMDDKVYYRVQFMTSEKKMPENSTSFKDLNDINFYKHNKLYKYTTGNFKSFKQANSLKNKMRKKKYKDAFIVAFLNGKRISLKEAKKISKN